MPPKCFIRSPIVDDLTESQAAMLMSVSANTVKKYLKKAKEKLRATVSLDSYGPDYGPEGEYE